MATYECIKDTQYGRRDYKIGDKMELADSLVHIAVDDEIISSCFKLKTKAPAVKEDPVKKPIAMSEMRGSFPDDLTKIENDMKAEKHVAEVPEPKKKGNIKEEGE